MVSSHSPSLTQSRTDPRATSISVFPSSLYRDWCFSVVDGGAGGATRNTASSARGDDGDEVELLSDRAGTGVVAGSALDNGDDGPELGVFGKT